MAVCCSIVQEKCLGCSISITHRLKMHGTFYAFSLKIQILALDDLIFSPVTEVWAFASVRLCAILATLQISVAVDSHFTTESLAKSPAPLSSRERRFYPISNAASSSALLNCLRHLPCLKLNVSSPTIKLTCGILEYRDTNSSMTILSTLS